MDAQIQHEIFNAMENPDFYPHPVSLIQQKDTHISKVFLTGETVYKIKKPVDFGFLNFSTLEKRRYYCLREILLNRRLSRNIYLEVIPITWDNGQYAIGGTGKVVEYALRMRQLPEARSLEQLIDKRELDQSDMADLGYLLARFYLQAPQSKHLQARQGWKNLLEACEENFRQTQDCSRAVLDSDVWETVKTATFVFLKRKQPVFLQRFNEKKIRDCHGDLRTGHIYFIQDEIQIIDCIEFNDQLRHIDIVNDLAFLLMDLDFQGKPEFGDCLLDQFIRQTSDFKAFLLLSFYKCYRAVVRCKVNCILLRSNSLQAEERKKISFEAMKYLNLAYRYSCVFFRPVIWAVCGMPATGKSTIAEALSKILEIKVYHSDEVRKKLFGLSPHDNGIALAGEKLYSSSASSLTYGKLLSLAQQEIGSGASVILDATFSRKRYRQDLINLAKDKGIKLIFIECTASDEIMKKRLFKRKFHPSVSDARIENFQSLKAGYESFSKNDTFVHVCVNTGEKFDASIRCLLIQAFRIDPVGPTECTTTDLPGISGINQAIDG